MKKHKYTAIDDARLLSMKREGYTAAEIADRLGRTVSSVQNRSSVLRRRATAVKEAVTVGDNEYVHADVRPPFMTVKKSDKGTVSRSATMLVYDGTTYGLAHFEREQTDEYVLEAWIDAFRGTRTKVTYWRNIPKVRLDAYAKENNDQD